MLGNDIVDIEEAHRASNWRRPRLLDKLFTPKEQKLISHSENSFLMVWQLWSMKEAAYKLYTQLCPSRFYNPKNFKCNIEAASKSVSYNTFYCYVETKMTSDYILSEAHLNQSKMVSEVLMFNSKNVKDQSTILKTQLLKKLSIWHSNENSIFSIVKDEYGIPKVKPDLNTFTISLSHHGKYGAYAVQKRALA